MRLGANRDHDDAEARLGRPSYYRAESRDWYAPDDVAPYSSPQRTRAEQIQRPDEKALRGPGRGPRSSDAPEPTMPQPRIIRASTDTYRRPSEIVVYEDEDTTSDDYRRSRRRTRSPEYKRPHVPLHDHRNRPPEPIDSPEDDDEAQIEVVEELDAEQFRRHKRRERRHLSRDDHADSSEGRRRRARQIIPSSSEDEEIEIRHRHSSPIRASPVRRPVLRREVSDSPRYERPRVPSVIDNSRPPVVSTRRPKVIETREVYREERSRQPAVNTVRQARSSSRRPPSLLGSIFGGSSSRLASPERSMKYYQCMVCLGEVPSNKCAKLKCGHRRCYSCLKRQFKLSITDPQEMPPRCCTSDHISLRHVDKLFDLSFKKTWNRKFAEFSTRNRIYCPSRRCGEWIKPANISRDRESGRKIARCEFCKTRVCVSCNGKWHYSRSCPRDDETARFLEQAKEEGWKRCYRCRAMVMLKEGCNHMTCRCGAEFCMICGVKWKGCDCPWFNYDSESDRLEHMNIARSGSRGDIREVYLDDLPSAREMRGEGKVRVRPRLYETDSFSRRVRDHSDEDKIRRIHKQGDDDDTYDVIGDVVGVGNTSGHFMNDNYRREGQNGPPRGRPGYQRAYSGGRDYVAGVSRARGFRDEPMEARLADRLSESRQAPGSMPSMEAPPPPNPLHLASGIMPPPVGMPPGPPGLMGEGMYDMRAMNRVIVERDPNDYDDDGSYGSRDSRGRRRHRRREIEPPKSSTLAGLNGRGVGMGRVDVWRKFVEPGDPEGELAAAAAASA